MGYDTWYFISFWFNSSICEITVMDKKSSIYDFEEIRKRIDDLKQSDEQDENGVDTSNQNTTIPQQPPGAYYY